MRFRARWRNWPHQWMRLKIYWIFTKSRSSHQVRVSFGTTCMPQPSKTDWGTEGPHQGFIHITSMTSMTQNWERDIFRPRGLHTMNSLWPFVDAASFQFSLVWAILWALMARTKNLQGCRQSDFSDEESEYPTQCENCCRKQGYFGGPPSVRLPLRKLIASKFHQRGWPINTFSWSKQIKWSCRITFGSWLLYCRCFLFNGLCFFLAVYTSKLLLTLMTLMIQCCCQNCFPRLWYILFFSRSFEHFAMVSMLVLCCWCSAYLSVCCLSFCSILSLSLSFLIIYPFIHPS